MTRELINAIRRGLATGKTAMLLPSYAQDAVMESYLDGRREVFTGRKAISEQWARLSRTATVEKQVMAGPMPDGFELDIQRETQGGRPVRQIHRVQVEHDRITRHVLYPALPRQAMVLPPNGLGPVTLTMLEEFQHDGQSGAALYTARLHTGEPVIVKHIRPAADWMARATRDPGREALLHTESVYHDLPPEISSAVLEAIALDGGWILVMKDISQAQAAARRSDRRATYETMLAAVHVMHAKFSGAPLPFLCSLEDRLRLFSPLRPLLERHRADTLPKTLTTSWECFADQVDPELVEAVLRIAIDPTGLLRALREAGPGTLLHGDYRPSNLGLASGTVLALDWGLAAYGPADLDFVWYLGNAAWASDEEREYLQAAWTRITGRREDDRTLDLAVIFHAVMGEVAFLVAEARHQLPGLPRPSEATVRWWLRRLAAAFERVGDLHGTTTSDGHRG
ncbi:phosphotransferase [[Actinomadura] parvosata]|uniref:phosphotransferase n=1 Tax=[Actinomadura] parvosata TaxID=1955412 RepID=UPI00406C2624